ncbi:tripartite tricarboxylate transporter substrate binding protein [Variovorax sp. EL159]|uniref:tripartite tricarboxylate transporter substrate binding protein n=1 Tax=Variovorax sp. EL159 TaxID=1566270 RepID=UPI0008822815|nr:tripartite tricarboxylate transporter substrate binding protein [Variovorax sp. EL159]SCX73667.1 Tripartite-type tricarboxylate transporter, receptor component TctC [Variovorax sp. EL159]
MRLSFLARFFAPLLAPLAAAFALAGACTPATAATYPDKPIRIIVGFPAGSTGDLIVRVLGPRMTQGLGQPVIVENRPGAGSSIAAEAVAHAPPDGYTLLLSTTANVINTSLYPNLRFSFTKDLAPVTLLAEAPALLIARADLPSRTVKELVVAASDAPGKFSYGSSGNGTFTHLYGELFNQVAQVRLTHVPYKGGAQALTDVMAGRVDLAFTPAAPVLAQVNAGRVKALAVIGRQRIAALPQVPTFAEAGIADFNSALWFGLHAPAGTPGAIVERLSSELQKVLADPEVRRQLNDQTVEAIAATPSQFASTIASESSKWARVIGTAGIKID